MKSLSILDYLAIVLVVVGGLNWGLVGAFNYNLVSAILGDMTLPAKAVYILVGLSAVYVGIMLIKLGKKG